MSKPSLLPEKVGSSRPHALQRPVDCNAEILRLTSLFR